MIKVGVLGARGRMGREVIRAVSEAPDLDLAAEVDLGDERDALTGCDVVVDFTHPGAVMDNLRWCVEHDLDTVVGTSGFGEDRLDEVQGWLADHKDVRVLIVPNFSVGAILMMRFAAQAARFFPSAEVIELHHAGKADAPSGTALRTVSMIGAARAAAGLGAPPDATASALPGARGATVGGRARPLGARAGLVAHQEVLFGGPGGDADDQARLAGPGLVHARRAARRPPDRLAPGGPHRGPGGPPRPGLERTVGACAEASRPSARPSPSRSPTTTSAPPPCSTSGRSAVSARPPGTTPRRSAHAVDAVAAATATLLGPAGGPLRAAR